MRLWFVCCMPLIHQRDMPRPNRSHRLLQPCSRVAIVFGAIHLFEPRIDSCNEPIAFWNERKHTTEKAIIKRLSSGLERCGWPDSLSSSAVLAARCRVAVGETESRKDSSLSNSFILDFAVSGTTYGAIVPTRRLRITFVSSTMPRGRNGISNTMIARWLDTVDQR